MLSIYNTLRIILFFLIIISKISICQNDNPHKLGYETLALGLISIDNEKFDKAIEHFEKALEYASAEHLVILSAESIANIYQCFRLTNNLTKADSLANKFDLLAERSLSGELSNTSIQDLLSDNGINYIKAKMDFSLTNKAINDYKETLNFLEDSNSLDLKAYVCNEISELLYYQNKNNDAEPYNVRAIEYSKNCKEYFVLGEAFFNRANYQTYLESMEVTIDLLHESINAFENLGSKYYQILPNSILCEAFIKTNQIKEALNQISNYYSLSKEFNLHNEIVRSFRMVNGIVLSKEIVKIYATDIKFLLDEMDNYNLTSIPSPYLNNIALFYWQSLGELENAQKYFIYSINNWSDIYPFNPYDSYGMVLHLANEIDSCLSTYLMAVDTYQLLVKKFQKIEMKFYFQSRAAFTYIHIGDIYLNLYDYKNSLRYFLKGLEISNASQNNNDLNLKSIPQSSLITVEKYNTYELNFRVALAYGFLGQYDKVKSYCYAALQNPSPEKAEIFPILALAYLKENEMDSAVYYYNKVLDSDAELNTKISAATYKLDYASDINDERMINETMEQINSLDISEDKLGKDSQFYYKNMATLQFYNGDPDYDRYFQIADSIALHNHHYHDASFIRKNRAVFYFRKNDIENAFAYIDSSIMSMNQYLLNLSDPDAIKSIIWQSTRSYVPLLLSYGFHNFEETNSSEYLKRVVDLSEIVTARSTLEEIRLSNIKATTQHQVNSDLIIHQKQLSQINDSLRMEKNLDRQDSLLKSRDRIYDDYKYLLSRYQLDIYKSGLGDFSPVSFDKIKDNLIDDNNVIIRYFLYPTIQCAIFISKSEISYFYLPPINNIELGVKSIRSYFNLFSSSSTSEKYILKKYCYQLYNDLLGPIADKIRDKNLIIIPDQILYYLPFELLINDATNFSESMDYKDINFLIKDHSISYTPSLSLLYYLDKKEPVKTNDVLLVGKSNFGTIKEKDDQFTSREMLSQINNLQDLPGVESELKSIAENLDKDYSVKILLNENASEQELKREINSKDYKYIHIATHGYVDDSAPQFSALLLNENIKSSDTEDGLLQSYEIASLDVNTDLTVLSACNTGLGKLYSGEGMIGLNQAFFISGSKSLCLTLWSISDASTSLFMTYFYSNLTAGMTKREALRQAKLSLMSNQKYASPYYWAPYILSGAFN